jgi:capsular exopolysaccharide synthesis family protein
MELRTYLEMIRRRGWIILVAALLAGLAGLGVSRLQTPLYRATVKISAVPARPDWGLGQQAKDLLRNFVNNINTNDTADRVIRRAQFDMNSYQLLSKVTVSAEPDNFIIRIDAKDEDPKVAREIALTMANDFTDDRKAFYETQDKNNRIDVKLVDSIVDPVLIQPKPVSNLLAGLVLGGLLGALIVLVLEWMAADILATPEHVERTLNLPVLGTSPAVERTGSVVAGKGPQMTVSLISITNPTSPAAEAYRRLRANLTYAGAQAPLQTLLIAATSDDPDKAAFAANLAVAFARIGRQVILVDGDLRHPAQHTIFGLSNTTGLSTALKDGHAALPLQSTSVDCLKILTSGPAVEVPSETVASRAMQELVQRLRTMAEIVIFDAPPVLLATDASELAAFVDGALLTISAGHTKREQAQRAKDLLSKVGARIVGTALVNVAADAASSKYLVK